MEETRILTADEKKQEFIRKYYEDEHLLAKATPEQKDRYIKYVEEGIKKDWIIALYAKAYGCYGGNELFKCDWFESRDCLLKIIELQGDKDPFIYNTLGYIYYYGRCNDKQPEYDKAFKYFSVGSANGVFESMYKTADMYIAGKGVPKSEKAGAKIILGMYEENKDIFSDDNEDCKFADVALRVGGLFERGCGVDQDYEIAFFHYLEAQYAIDLRMMDHDYYGDSKVAGNISDALERVKEKLPEGYFKDKLSVPSPVLIGMLLSESVGLDIELKKSGDSYFLFAERYASEDMNSSVLVNIPQTRFCQLVNDIQVRIEGLDDVGDLELPMKAFINSIEKGEDDRTWIFSFRDMPMLEITCDAFVFENYFRFD